MGKRLVTRLTGERAEIRKFFDEQAAGYSEQHGNAEKLLAYRTQLIAERVGFRKDDVVLDVGCGTGHHLMALAERFDRGIGIDFSPEMIRVAKEMSKRTPVGERLEFRVDTAEKLSTIEDNSVDVVLCIGVIEHIPDQSAVISTVYRVLKSGGRFLCLTPNGEFLWYAVIAPILGLDTQHLSSDHFLTKEEFQDLLFGAGFARVETHDWSFIPRGDMSPVLGFLLQGIDKLGSMFGVSSFRGGLRLLACKA